MPDDKIRREKYHEEIEAELPRIMLRWPNSEERWWELARLVVDEKHAIQISRETAIAQGKDPFDAQLEDGVRRARLRANKDIN